MKLPRFPVAIAGVSLRYYSISGTSTDDLIKQMEAKGSATCKLSDALACFRGSSKWTSQGSIDAGTGICHVTSVTWMPTYTISLPKWSGPSRVPAALVKWWKGLFAHIVWHESQHLAIAKSYVPKFKAAILAGSCGQAAEAKIVAQVQSKLDAAQTAFDASQSGYVYPPYDG